MSAVLLIPTCLSFVLLDPSSGRPVELRQPYWMADRPALQMLSAPSALAPSQVNLPNFINLQYLSLQADMHQIYSFVSEYNRASRIIKRMTKLRSRRRLIWLPPPPLLPLPSASCLTVSIFLCVAGRAYWRERVVDTWRAKSHAAEEAWSSIHHSILSGFNPLLTI